MRVLDAGCGSGKVSSILYEMIQPGGELIAVDFSEDRISYAKSKFSGKPGLQFILHDLREHSNLFSDFDLVWVRFLLEHYYNGSIDIVKILSNYLKPNGQMCLLDLDYNALTHYEMKIDMQDALLKLVHTIEKKYNFDAYAGRKLYSYLFDLDYKKILLDVIPHHLIYGTLNKDDEFNWNEKFKVVTNKMPDVFNSYPGGHVGFYHDFINFLKNPRRFTYTPLILCKGIKQQGDIV
jgi:SAM-dependent methyltransferase